MDLRFEKKFIVDDYSEKELELWLKSQQYFFHQEFEPRQINNLYFDDYDFNSYQDSHAGLSQRLKIRIRWYGDLLATNSNFNLELKHKDGQHGSKETFPLPNFPGLLNISRTDLPKLFKKDLPLAPLQQIKNHNPTVITCYLRKYYNCPLNLRVTIDYQIKYYPFLLNCFRESFYTKVQSFILEVKYPLKIAQQAQDFVQSIPFTQTRNSKYTEGIDATLF